MIRLPGWAGIATGILQLIVFSFGTLLGTYSNHSATMLGYRSERQKLADDRKAVQSSLAALDGQLKYEADRMRELTAQIQELVTQHNLSVEVPNVGHQNPAHAIGNASQRQQLPALNAAMDPMAQFHILRAEYDRASQDYEHLQERRGGQATEAIRLNEIVLARPGMLDGLVTATAHTAVLTGGLPFLGAWIAWVTGLALISAGFSWLAVAERLDPGAELE